MSKALVFPVTLLAACSALGSTTSADSMQCGSEAASRRTACPSQAALGAHLRDRWALDAATTLTISCLPGEFADERAWLIHAVTGDAPGRAATFLLQPTCAALTDPAPRPATAGDRDVGFELEDLDGDRFDEVLARRHEVVGAARSTVLEVYRYAAGRLLPAGKVRLELDDGPVHCAATLRYVPRPGGGLMLALDATATTPVDPLCLEPGLHELELGASGLRRRQP